MRRHGGGRAVWPLIASLAVLLPAGVLAVVASGDPGSTPILAGDQVGAAAVGLAPVPDEPVVTTTTTLSSTTSTARTVVPTSVQPTTTTTTRRPPTTTTTSTRASAPTSTLPATTVATTPLPSRWSATSGQMSVSVRMEPPAPVAGQPVTFTVTVAPGVGCCLGATIAFGDEDDIPATGPDDHYVPVSQACGSQTPVSGARAHTYAEPGPYRAIVRVIGLECLPVPDANGVPTGDFAGVVIRMCVGVGPGSEARACAP
jgi:hypothetical protein